MLQAGSTTAPTRDSSTETILIASVRDCIPAYSYHSHLMAAGWMPTWIRSIRRQFPLAYLDISARFCCILPADSLAAVVGRILTMSLSGQVGNANRGEDQCSNEFSVWYSSARS